MWIIDLITGVGCLFIGFLAADKASSELHRWWARRQYKKAFMKKVIR